MSTPIPYAIAKGIDWHAGAGRGIASGKVIGRNADCIIVPVKDMAGKLTAVQCINADAVSLVFHHYKGNACAFAACGKSSMDRLTDAIAAAFKPDTIVVLEDADD